MNGYKCFYKGKSIDVYAETTYQAQTEAAKALRVKRQHEVDVYLCEKDVVEGTGQQVVHEATF